MIRFVGLDVHRKSTRACIRDAGNAIVAEESFGGTREDFLAFAQRHLRTEDQIALEATFHAWAIAEVLGPHVRRVVVSNPLATKAIAQSKVKTDKVDARVLSELLRCDYLPLVWTPDGATRELRNLCARRATLVSDMVRIKNRIHGVLAKALIPTPEKGDMFDRKGRAWLDLVELPELAGLQMRSDLRLLRACETELEEHDRLLILKAWDDPRVKLLITLPGVDVTVALSVLAALGDIERFRDGDHLAAYLGLVPSTHQSADHCYHGPITKRGNGKARWLLVQAAQHLGSHPGPLGVFFRRLAKRKNRSVAVVATARKLAVIAWHMLSRNEPYRYAQPRPTADKLARFRVKATGFKRKGGLPKGTPRPAQYGSGIGTRTIPALTEVCGLEGVPLPTSPGHLKPGERRVLEESGCLQFVLSAQRRTTVPRKGAQSTNTTCGPAEVRN